LLLQKCSVQIRYVGPEIEILQPCSELNHRMSNAFSGLAEKRKKKCQIKIVGIVPELNQLQLHTRKTLSPHT
jgi:hypothetical protein